MAKSPEARPPQPAEMTFRELTAPPEGQCLLEAAWSAEGSFRPTRVLPDGCTDLVFDPKRRRVSVVGVMTVARVVAPSASHVFGLRMHPWAVRAVLGVAAEHLCDRDLPLAEVHPAWFARVRTIDRVEDAVEAFTEACMRWRLGQRLDTRVSQAAQSLGDPTEGCEVASAAREVGLSERQLQRVFLDHVGVTPKVYTRVARLRSFARDATSATLAEAAMAAGYADQSHLCREVRALTGVSPRRLRGAE
jgi:AraC-like DNA-binding protein